MKRNLWVKGRPSFILCVNGVHEARGSEECNGDLRLMNGNSGLEFGRKEGGVMGVALSLEQERKKGRKNNERRGYAYI